MSVPERQIRARHSATTVTVYQAYPPDIAVPAVAAGRFVAPFKRERMTWIKPSFLWMMYRCGWATKPGQERVLSIEITRAGFEWALGRAVDRYVDDWIVAVEDVTATVGQIRDLLRRGDEQAAAARLPVEHVYPLADRIAAGLGAGPVGDPDRRHRQ
ncbi:DUF4291 domain-containing protein [Micromonospora sp. HM134]|uniref:DUF4291 family protein n=1 Tax=unclassified Micromonospora TaxID=2617518 RepID=UPI001198C761|nr:MULTISPECIES: DUF4291 family protein [unclassified Micromonospora]QDY09369.1 DUF4291 domain-containing protein [Micromonospora sp. HM134]